jgi:hypothetical protein
MDKTCSKCKITKPETDYHTANGKPICICKVCKNEESRQYRQNRSPYAKKMWRDYYEKYCVDNAERIKAHKKKYYQTHRDIIIARAQRYRESCKNEF